MNQLTIVHKKVTIDQNSVVIEEKTKKDRRPGKGRAMALSRRIYRLQNTDTFYVESETRDDQYYFVKFKQDGLESYCSCKDNSIRGIKCKHLFAIEFAIKWGTIKEIDKLPTEKPNDCPITTTTSLVVTKSYIDDDYSF